MKIKFSHVPVGGGATKTATLCLGLNNSPQNRRSSHTGVAQSAHYVRAERQTFFGRGGSRPSEQFTAIFDHASYWAAVLYTKDLSEMAGRSGQLMYEGDSGGQLVLNGCVCVKADPTFVGNVSFTDFEFVGGTWV